VKKTKVELVSSKAKDKYINANWVSCNLKEGNMFIAT